MKWGPHDPLGEYTHDHIVNWGVVPFCATKQDETGGPHMINTGAPWNGVLRRIEWQPAERRLLTFSVGCLELFGSRCWSEAIRVVDSPDPASWTGTWSPLPCNVTVRRSDAIMLVFAQPTCSFVGAPLVEGRLIFGAAA